ASTLMTIPNVTRKRRESRGRTDRVRRTIRMVCFTWCSPRWSMSALGAVPDTRADGIRSAGEIQLVQSVRSILGDEREPVPGDVVDATPPRGRRGLHRPSVVGGAVAVQVRGADALRRRADLRVSVRPPVVDPRGVPRQPGALRR